MPQRPAKSAAAAHPPSLQHEIGKKKPFDVPEQETALNIVRTAALLTCETLRFFKSYKLTEAGYNALRILRGHHPTGVPSLTIGEQLIAQVPDVTRLVDRLVDQRLAERHRIADDRRVVMVHITRIGLDLLAKIDKPLIALHEEQLGHMTRAELKELSRLLTKARHRT